jgi:hypothetical protein
VKNMLESTSMTNLMLTIEFSNLRAIGLCLKNNYYGNSTFFVNLQHHRIDFIEILNEK